MSGSDAVSQLGIETYNLECRVIVMRYAGEWRQIIERLGRWIDFDHDYKAINEGPHDALMVVPKMRNHQP